MWAKAAKWIGKFDEGVITALDADGYPVSVRQTGLPYDAPSGTMPVVLPEALGAVPGPANLLCHSHDDDLWSLRAIQVQAAPSSRSSKWRRSMLVSLRNTPTHAATQRGPPTIA